MIDGKTKISELTLEQLAEFLHHQNITPASKRKNKEYVYGLKGLAKLLGCSRTTAFKIKNSGDIDIAISQTGKVIVFDTEKVLEILKNKK